MAVANIEAFFDGKLEATPRRLSAVLQALGELDVLLDDVAMQPAIAMRSEPRVVDICNVIANEVAAIEAAARDAGVSLAVEQCARAHPQCLSFLGDPVRVGQLLKNLLLNAIRYSPPGGTVTVECRREPGALAFSVFNAGVGIPPDELPHIFEAGFRGKQRNGVVGSGMGLSVAKQVVDAHHGTIGVETAEGRGVRFTVRLPDAPSTAPTCSTCAAQTHAMPVILAESSETRLLA